MIIDEKNYLEHYGILRRSGRYPWGSGGNAETRSRDFLGYLEDMKSKGLSEKDILTAIGWNTTDFRAAKAIAKNQKKASDIAMAQRLKNKGMSNVEIGKKMEINESSVRSLLEPGQKQRADVLQTTANMLKRQVADKEYLDVGTGTELSVGVSRNKMDIAIKMLEEEGYKLHYVKQDQLTTGNSTSMKVLTAPGVPYSQVFKNQGNIRQINEFTLDRGETFLGIQPPLSIKSSRIGVNYKENGGADADGVIYVRPGVKDVSLGGSRYAQVRIAVDGTHYLKGMAVYKDGLPKGVDLVFNTNKSKTANKLDVMKPMEKDATTGQVNPHNPFGSYIKRQLLERQPNGKDKVTSVMNILDEEGNWGNWSKTLSSQMLSKQSPTLAKSQLDMTYERRKNEFDTIMKLTNPTVRDKLLRAFAEDADSAAVHLKAAALPRTYQRVLLPVKSLKENEVYSPTHRPGERVALIRHPHGGKFEIPELVVNNRNREARKLLGPDAPDAIGIHPNVAKRLSGADFDGDTVLAIPNGSGKIKATAALAGLKNFDPQRDYPGYEGMPKMSPKTKQNEMGNISNLITDMTIKGANPGEIARAVRHSMVVIDAEKHDLNYRESARANGISQLKEKYQGGPRAGAATLVSRAGSKVFVLERKQGFRIDPATGKKQYTETGRTYVDKNGKVIPSKTKSKRLAETDDAFTLSSGTKIESVYAQHSNSLKSLANLARKEAVNTRGIKRSPSAAKTYEAEVNSLNAKLNVALRNRPRERQALIVANANVKQIKAANPGLDADQLKKIKGQALTAARARVGAKKELVNITDREWHAIQSGAIAPTRLRTILENADLDQVKQLATPRTPTVMTSAKQRRAEAMLASGFTQAEVADHLGVALSTLKSSIAT